MHTNPLDLPLPIVVDNLLPLLSNADLATLRSVSKQAKALVEDEVLWKRKVVCDFTFPPHATARVGGWFNLYRGLSNPHVYVWGQTNNYRLGLDVAMLDQAVVSDAAFIREGIPYPIKLNTISQSNGRTGARKEEGPGAVVEIVAGGWAFHARTSKGRVWYWGTMDGETFAGNQTTLRDPGKPIQTPQLMHDIPAVSSLSGGRCHVAALTKDDEILEWRAWGTVWKLEGLPLSITEAPKPTAYDEASSSTEAKRATSNIKQLEAGWSFTAVLTHTGEIWLWYSDWSADAFIRSYYSGHPREAMMHANPPGHGDQKVFPLTITPVKLPSVVLTPTEQTKQTEESTRVVQIAAGEDFLIALTEAGTMHKIDLHLPPSTGEDWGLLRQAQELRIDADDRDLQVVLHRLRLTRYIESKACWERLSTFERPQELSDFDSRWLHGQRGCGRVGKISHISAHFRQFVAFLGIVACDEEQEEQGEGEGKTLVLLGDASEGGDRKPKMIPELQARGVIKVTMGDYHYGALTQKGEILTWGAFSKGALGNWSPPWTWTGETVAEEPTSTSTSTSTDEGERGWLSNLIPLPRMFRSQQARIGFAGRGTSHTTWPNMVPSPTHRRGHTQQDIARPTRISIHVERSEDEPEPGTEPFAFDLAFAGWHSSALVMNVNPHS